MHFDISSIWIYDPVTKKQSKGLFLISKKFI